MIITSKLKPMLPWMIGLVLVTALTGCATSNEVKEIVDSSNAAIIQASLFPDRASLNGDGKVDTNEELDAIANRVAIFVDAYPDRLRTINPLRLRLAWAYLNAGRPNSAQAIYQEINGDYLTFETQKLIYKHFDDFVWWFNAANRSWELDDETKATQAIEDMKKTASEQGRTNYLRAWLNYTAAKIGIMRAATKRSQDFKNITQETLDDYRKSFTDKERHEAQQTSVQQSGAVDRLDDETMLRWYLSVPAIHDEASENWHDIFEECLPLEVTGNWLTCKQAGSGGCDCAFNPPSNP